MKKIYTIIFSIILIFMLSACANWGSPISTTRPLPSSDPITDESDNESDNDSDDDSKEKSEPDSSQEPDSIEDSDSSQDPEPTEDKRDNPEEIRQEIANLLRDTEELINEGLYDDAKSVLRDLRSRDLTKSEQNRVNELSSKLVGISD